MSPRAAGEAANLARPEAPLLRRTRWRLIAWSGGSTLVILVVLGASIYVAAASTLAAGGIAQLQARVDELSGPRASLVGPGVGAGRVSVSADPSQPGLTFGGPTSGTLALVTPASEVLENPGFPPAETIGLDVLATNAEMRDVLFTGQSIVRESSIGGGPVRLLIAPIDTPSGTFVAVVIGDRTAERDTLNTLSAVLLGGGVAVLAASLGVGYVYAGRALVPIRESLRRQREFAADASHELRTPLSIVRAAIAEIRGGRFDPAVVDRALEDLDAGSSRLGRLVEDLLLLARTDAEAVELVVGDTDLALVAAEGAEALEPVAVAGHVHLALDVRPAPVRGDEDRLRQLVAILVDNAIRHSPPNGRVTVTVRPGTTLLVEDEGPGIAPEHLDRVFERFWRAPDAPPGGTGLGLAIAQWIVQRHGGTIAATNRVPIPGAKFVVRLPDG